MSLVVELVAQVLFQLVVELAGVALGRAFEPRSRPGPVLSYLGIAVLGGLGGLVTSWVLVVQLGAPLTLMLASALLTPCVLAFAGHAFGEWRRARGHEPMRLASWQGGLTMGLAMVAVELLLARL